MEHFLNIQNPQGLYELNLMKSLKKHAYSPCRLRIRLLGDFFKVLKEDLAISNTYTNIEQLFTFAK